MYVFIVYAYMYMYVRICVYVYVFTSPLIFNLVIIRDPSEIIIILFVFKGLNSLVEVVVI